MNATDEHAARRWTLGAEEMYAVRCKLKHNARRDSFVASAKLKKKNPKRMRNRRRINGMCAHDDWWWVMSAQKHTTIYHYFILEIVPNRHKEWKSERKKNVFSRLNPVWRAHEKRDRDLWCNGDRPNAPASCGSVGRDSGLRENATLELAQCELWTCWRRGRAHTEAHKIRCETSSFARLLHAI